MPDTPTPPPPTPEGREVSCGHCGATVVVRSFMVSANSALARLDPHYRPDGSGMCHERAHEGRTARTLRRARNVMLDTIGATVEAWPCLCPDSYRANGVTIPDCPLHTLGPALLARLDEQEGSPCPPRLARPSVPPGPSARPSGPSGTPATWPTPAT